MKKKVLFVITKSNWGGAQRYVFDMATALPREQFDVAVAFGGAGEAGAGAGQLEKKLKEKNIRTIFVPELSRDVSFKNDRRALRSLVQVFKTEQPDVVHLNSSKAGGIGALAARRAGVKKIIFTAHGWAFWEPRNLLARGMIFFGSWLTVLLSHKTICVSEFDKRHIRWMPFVRKKIVVIHNGIAGVDFFSREDARDALFNKEVQAEHTKDLWAVTSAELHPNKNIFAGIDAVARHNSRRPQKLFYAVMGGGELRTELEAYINEKGLSKYVALLGFIGDSARYLKAFDIFLLPSKKEGLPYGLLEAGQAELSAVASNVGGIPEIIESSVSGMLINPHDTESVVRALDTLVAQKDLRKKLGSALKQKVDKDFSLQKMAGQTQELYLS